MSGWKEYKLGVIAKFSQGIQVPIENQFNSWSNGLIRFIRIVDFTKGDNTDIRYIKYPGEMYCVKDDDLVMIRYGSQTAGKIAQGFKGAIANNTFKITPNENILIKKYLFYFLAQKSIYDFFQLIQTSSTMPAITFEMISDLNISVPSLPEQKSIASILSSLDDKIYLLHRQNKTLEALAETLFRQWFVEEAEEGWDRGKLGELGKIICGKTPSKKIHSYFGGNIPFIKIPDMHGKTFIFDTEDTLTEDGANLQQNKFLPPKSICVSCIATVGLVSMNAFNSHTNQQINSIIPSKDVYRYFLYLKLTSMRDELLSMASGGTATDNLNTGDFSDIEIIKPNDDLLRNFHKKVQIFFDKIFTNQIQIRTLTRLRDTLLPKLMSGEVRVSN